MGEAEKAEKSGNLRMRDPEKTGADIFGKAVDVTISEEGKKLQQSDGRKGGEETKPDAPVGENGPAKPTQENNAAKADGPGGDKETAADDSGVKGPGGSKDKDDKTAKDGDAPQIAKAPGGPFDPPTVATNSKDKKTLEQALAKLAESYATMKKKYDTIASDGGSASMPAKKLKSGMMKAQKMMAQIETTMKTAEASAEKGEKVEKVQELEQKSGVAPGEKSSGDEVPAASDEMIGLRE